MAQAPRNRRTHRATIIRRQAPASATKASPQPRHPSALANNLRVAAPWLLTSTCIILFGLAVMCVSWLAAHSGQIELAASLSPISAMVLALGCFPLLVAVVRLLEKPPQKAERCGLCRYYLPAPDGYDRGKCGVSLERHPTVRTASCDRFEFSERAMVRDRLTGAPHIVNSGREP